MELYKIPKSLRKSFAITKILEETFGRLSIAEGQHETADRIAILIEILKDELDELAGELLTDAMQNM